MASKSRGLMRMEREIFFSSSNCSLVFVISRRASWTLPIPLSVFFGPLDPCPAACCFSFCACIMACLFFSASSQRSLFSPFVDLFTELFIEFTLFGFLSGFQEVSISLFRAHLRSARLRFCLSFFYFFFLLLFLFFFFLLLFLSYFLLLIVFFVRHPC